MPGDCRFINRKAVAATHVGLALIAHRRDGRAFRARTISTQICPSLTRSVCMISFVPARLLDVSGPERRRAKTDQDPSEVHLEEDTGSRFTLAIHSLVDFNRSRLVDRRS